uniref:Uncharacterized protein n=2 Tax=Pseudo-nitzschia australis TaxID=44445 RepID=A0A7S4AFZ9_9STRA
MPRTHAAEIAALKQQIAQLIARLDSTPGGAILSPAAALPPAIVNAVSRAQATGGIPGYDNERALSDEEVGLRDLYVDLGVCEDTANEMFCCGWDTIENLVDMKSKDTIKSNLWKLTKRPSPMCPAKNKIHIGTGFTKKVTLFIQWLQYQPIIGGDATVDAWHAADAPASRTRDRLEAYDYLEKADTGTDLDLPDGLKSLK